MNKSKDILNIFKGQIVWGVTRSHGSMFYWNCGDPHLEIREPRETKSKSKKVIELSARRKIDIVGDAVFLFELDKWIIFKNNIEFCNSESNSIQIERCLKFIDGQKIVDFYLIDELQFVFKFDLNCSIRLYKNEYSNIICSIRKLKDDTIFLKFEE
jgi:hypothetical protein